MASKAISILCVLAVSLIGCSARLHNLQYDLKELPPPPPFSASTTSDHAQTETIAAQ